MTLSVADRVLETSTTQGTGTLNLAGPITGFRSFAAAVSTGAKVPYVIDDGTDWEVGIGTFTDATTDTLARTTVIASSNAGAAVNWGPGTRNVRLAPIAQIILQRDESKNFTQMTGTGGGTANAQTITSPIPIIAYSTNALYFYKASVTNTAAFTVNIDGIGVKNVKHLNGAAPTGGEVIANGFYILMYDGTNLIILNPSADINSLTEDTSPDSANDFVRTWDASATIEKKVKLSNVGIVDNAIQDFRLTLTTGVPVTTADVTAATTIYAAPYKGNRIALYDGANWNVRTSTEFSVALGTITNDLMYDVFCYDNAGTPTLEILAWTNNTTRATAVIYQDGILVKSGAATRRYLGSFCTTSTTTTEDSVSNRFLWNYYHRVPRALRAFDATSSWAYSSVTVRQANASTSNQLNFVVGRDEDTVSARLSGCWVNNSSASYANCYNGFGLDSTTSFSSASSLSRIRVSNTDGSHGGASFEGYTGIGKHYLAWLEKGAGTADTQTWYTGGAAGITGSVMA